MKISQKEKLKIRLKLISAAVEIISTKGFKGASMREIARAGNVSDATIYNYFPTKEKLISAYFVEKQLEAITIIKSIQDFHTFTFQEQLQTLFETKIELFQTDRQFVTIAFERAFQAPISSRDETTDGLSLFANCVKDILEASIEANELPYQPWQGLIPELITDQYLGIIYYWLKDESEDFIQTTQLIDKSLNLTASLLQSGVVSKALDMASFLFRRHLGKYLDELVNEEKQQAFTKRPFMESGFEK